MTRIDTRKAPVEEAYKFMRANPAYTKSLRNANRLWHLLEFNDLEFTADNLTTAFKSLQVNDSKEN